MVKSPFRYDILAPKYRTVQRHGIFPILEKTYPKYEKNSEAAIPNTLGQKQFVKTVGKATQRIALFLK
jgi:hypothetical protein